MLSKDTSGYRERGNKLPSWPEWWRQLRDNLQKQPRCPEHPAYPLVRTPIKKVINDILKIEAGGITVRSHAPRHRQIGEIKLYVIKAWWLSLDRSRSASLVPEDAPHRYRSRLVGAILLACFPDDISQDPNDKSVIRVGDRNGS